MSEKTLKTSTDGLYRKLKEKSIITINSIININGNRKSEHENVFEYNLNVLIDLCNEKLKISNRNNNQNNYKSNGRGEFFENSNSPPAPLGQPDYDVNNYENFIKKVNTSDGYRYKCVFNTDCMKLFTRKYRCIEHINTHTGEKPFQCEQSNCCFKTAYKRNLFDHITGVHALKKQLKHKIKAYHSNDMNFYFACDSSGCGYKCRYNYQLIKHKRIHTGEKPFKCDWNGCEFRTNWRKSLIKHKQTHTGEKPIRCDWSNCGFSTNHRSNLVRHRRTHTGEKPFKCFEIGCNYSAARKDSFNMHLFRHSKQNC